LPSEVSETLRQICLEISSRYEIQFLEIGCDDDHVHYYKMFSLEEIENYTKINNHLPGVPSAKEVKEQGGILINK
jgi:REP element-mobilizing transposase RayT